MLQALEQVLPGSPQTGHGDTEIHAEAFVKDTHWNSSQRTAGAREGPAESQLLSDHNSHSSTLYTMWGGDVRGVRRKIEAGKGEAVVLIFASGSHYQNLF